MVGKPLVFQLVVKSVLNYLSRAAHLRGYIKCKNNKPQVGPHSFFHTVLILTISEP
jgi:hypothetical protein